MKYLNNSSFANKALLTVFLLLMLCVIIFTQQQKISYSATAMSGSDDIKSSVQSLSDEDKAKATVTNYIKYSIENRPEEIEKIIAPIPLLFQQKANHEIGKCLEPIEKINPDLPEVTSSRPVSPTPEWLLKVIKDYQPTELRYYANISWRFVKVQFARNEALVQTEHNVREFSSNGKWFNKSEIYALYKNEKGNWNIFAEAYHPNVFDWWGNKCN